MRSKHCLYILILLHLTLTTLILIMDRKIKLLEQKEQEIQESKVEKQTLEDMKAVKKQEKVKTYVEEYKEKIKENPVEIHLRLGQKYMSQEKHKHLARLHFSKVLELKPDYPKKKVIEIWMKQLEK